MTNDNFDQHFDQNVDQLFEQAVPDVDPQAKLNSIEQATENFSQGIEASTRRSIKRENSFLKILNSIGKFFMNTTQAPTISNTFATIAVAFVAVSLVVLIPNFDEQFSDSYIDGHSNGTSVATPSVDANIETDIVDKQAQVIANNTQSKSGQIKSIDRTEIDRTPALNTPKEQTTRPQLSAERPTLTERPVLQEYDSELAISNGLSTSKSWIDSARALQRTRPLNEGSALFETDRIAIPLSKLEQQAQAQHRPDRHEQYADYQTSSIVRTAESPISTFSVDVDTASYSLIRNQLNQGFLPKPQAVRAEELINYFDYAYPLPNDRTQPFKTSISVLNSPWNQDKQLLHIGIKGYDIEPAQAPDSNLVFLLDVSGSMSSANKLPLVKQSINLLLDTLKPTDTVSIVVYAGAAGTVLEPTKVKEKNKIIAALQRLNAGGSTAGGAGIELAYKLAEQNFDSAGVNRIILATDGDFNVGLQSNDDLKTLVERKRDKGVFLSVLGFGRHNYQDDMMQVLAQHGNGVAAFIDSLSEAKKVLVDEATSTLFTIAKDVKLQVEFNPAVVSEYRLIGYETRKLKREDFNNDKVDAGDIGAGHTVTAIYEITPANSEQQSIDPARYTQNRTASALNDSNNFSNSTDKTEIGYVKIRYKLPNETSSQLIEQPIANIVSNDTNSEANFSIAVAGFAQLLSNNQYIGDLSYDDIIELAINNKGEDSYGYRSEFVQLVRMAKIANP